MRTEVNAEKPCDRVPFVANRMRSTDRLQGD
jgi:hypothetical protein